MNSTTLEPSFLQAALLMMNFKGKRMTAVQGAMLALALDGRTITAVDIPDILVAGSTHLAGAACGALVALDLLEVVGRVKSPKPNAKGRKLDQFRLADGRRGAANAWLNANGLPKFQERQAEMAL